jgi:DNA-binding NtrC family response regulator
MQRSVVLASADAALRGRLRDSLAGMRWKVREAGGGAEAMAQLEEQRPEALLVDSWLPDLEVGEFAGHIREYFPGIDLLRVDGDSFEGGTRSPRRHELLHALREAQDAPVNDGAAWANAPAAVPRGEVLRAEDVRGEIAEVTLEELAAAVSGQVIVEEPASVGVARPSVAIAEMIGASEPMMELARMIRLVAPRSTTVLIEGETGTGKEVVAKAIHRLGSRSTKPFAVLNCAAIPEALLEAELFGHTRGAFTGAVTSRTGRIEAANGGTLFLDEIGEMPLPLQAKMLRFLEGGELQRVGDNETMRVDVRVIAATHQHLEKRSADGTFRLDLYHRLAVFPLEVPALRERAGDIPVLVEFFLAEMGKEFPRKRVSAAAMDVLRGYSWPGNVRELAHVLERAAILVGDAAEIGVGEIRLKRV